MASSSRIAVIIGVDGAGRTHRLEEIVAASGGPVIRVNGTLGTLEPTKAAGLIAVDDAHRLSADELRRLTVAARSGVAIVLTRRPSVHSRELADLDEVVATTGRVEQLAPLGVNDVAEIVTARHGVRPTPSAAEELHRASGGLPGIAALLDPDPSAGPSAGLVARVARRLAQVEPQTASLARVLALRLDLSDAILATAATLETGLPAALGVLRDEGFLEPGAEVMLAAVAAAVLADLPAAALRSLHDVVARAMVTHGSDPIPTAGQLRAARARGSDAAAAYAAAGDRLRWRDPAAALAWYEDAIDAGLPGSTVAAGRAEASGQLGLAIDTAAAAPVTAEESTRVAMVEGAAQAHDGRLHRAAAALVATGAAGQILAVPGLVATGQLAPAQAVVAPSLATTPATEMVSAALRRFAEAALLAAADPMAAVPMLVEAADAMERVPATFVLPDTPHAVGAVVAVCAGDAAAAEHLLERALQAGTGGPVHRDRHHLLLAWVRLRAGRYDTAVAELARTTTGAGGMGLLGRERLLRAALSAGIARRSGDIARLREAWVSVEPQLVRRTVDLFTTEILEELVVAATRLRSAARVTPIVDSLTEIMVGLGSPAPWVVALGWLRLQVAIAAEDVPAAARVAEQLSSVAASLTGARASAQCAAARLWSDVLDGRVDAAAVLDACAKLAEAQLPWEGSRLAGQAAIRSADGGHARRLLEYARELSSAEVTIGERSEPNAAPGGLSEREVEVARMVLTGDTYREIGARLFISPKTVEHHVARIRTKLGATTRAEFVAALRRVLP